MSTRSRKTNYETSQGYFDGLRFWPHLTMTVGDITLECPAKLDYRAKLDQMRTDSGELIYALPGGGSITESGRIL